MSSNSPLSSLRKRRSSPFEEAQMLASASMTNKRANMRKGASKVILLISVAALLFLPITALAVGFAIMPRGATWNPVVGAARGDDGIVVGADCKIVQLTRTTVYSRSEDGGEKDAQEQPIHYLDDYLAGNTTDYISLSSDLHGFNSNHYTYGTKAYIPAIQNSFAGGKILPFKIVDTGRNFGGKTADNDDRRNNGDKYVDIAARSDALLNDGRLNLPNNDFPVVSMYVGNGCSPSNLTNGLQQNGDVKLTVPRESEDLEGTCNQIAIYMTARYYAIRYGKDPNSITKPNAPKGTCSTEELLNDELKQAGFDPSQFTVKKTSHNLPQNADATWQAISDGLHNGNPTVIETRLYKENPKVNQHWITITGMTADGKTITYNDPYKGQEKTLRRDDDHWGDGKSRSLIYVDWKP